MLPENTGTTLRSRDLSLVVIRARQGDEQAEKQVFDHARKWFARKFNITLDGDSRNEPDVLAVKVLQSLPSFVPCKYSLYRYSVAFHQWLDQEFSPGSKAVTEPVYNTAFTSLPDLAPYLESCLSNPRDRQMVNMVEAGADNEALARAFNIRSVKSTLSLVRATLEKGYLGPNGFMRVSYYEQPCFKYAAAEGRLPAQRFLRLNYTTEDAVLGYFEPDKDLDKDLLAKGYVPLKSLIGLDYELYRHIADSHPYDRIAPRSRRRIYIKPADLKKIAEKYPKVPDGAVLLASYYGSSHYRRLAHAAERGYISRLKRGAKVILIQSEVEAFLSKSA